MKPMHTTLALYIFISLVKRIDGMFVCPNDGMFENANDPNTFWHCAHGINYLKQCPASLIWSQAVQTCVWNGKYLYLFLARSYFIYG